ncbi:MAG: ABC transporter ATP-binding protein [Peptococcaceae bacterium]|nr:ABC transporter ATP-binding protein [Peptococcaceae bacterium]
MIEAKDVTYCYRKHSKPVLDGISASFDERCFYAIVGASGSGKTTLLSLLAGLDEPTQGKILYDGIDIRSTGLHAHRRCHVSLVFQNYNLIDYLTAEENVRLSGDGDVQALLAEVGLSPEFAKRSVLHLSGGQQQRVAIARALASPARVLLADEPTGNLDETTANGIIKLLDHTAHDLGKCVIAVTHSAQLARAADCVLCLDNGRLVQQ